MARPLNRDLVGLRFGRLEVLAREGSGGGQALWRCKCDCGSIAIIAGGQLNRSKTKSCGCYRRDFPKLTKTTHGLRHRPEYMVWNGMKQRCHNSNQKHYERYGGRGIYVCDEWRNSFAQFFADMGPRPTGRLRYTIERDDNDGPYAPWNCRWITFDEQTLNKRPRKRRLKP